VLWVLASWLAEVGQYHRVCTCTLLLSPAKSADDLALQGGLLPRHDWEALERDWLNPVSRGSLLPDFGLEGPVDVHLAQPNALQVGKRQPSAAACRRLLCWRALTAHQLMSSNTKAVIAAAPSQLFLPHASDAGTVRRVLLREGAAIMVRGARSVRLRRGLDLPAISLSEFAGEVMTWLHSCNASLCAPYSISPFACLLMPLLRSNQPC
jgi:hypothetical protein